MCVIVVGAGAAGMVGALVAARDGARVVLADVDFAGPSNLLVSGGLFPVGGSRFQRAAGIADDPDAFAADVREKAGGTANEAIVDAVATTLPRVLDFFVDELGLPIHLAAAIPAPGHRAPRLHTAPAVSGRELHALLRAKVAAEPRIQALDRAALVELGIDSDRVTGVRLAVDGRRESIVGDAVLLATGGFAASPALLAAYLPGLAGAIHIGAGPNDGVAIRIARAAGAAVAMMDGYQGQGHVNPAKRTRLGMALPLLGAMMVNRAGLRFVREDIGPSDLASFVLAQPGGVALEVFDQRCHAQAMQQGPYAEAWHAGNIFEASSIAALAAQAGIPDDALERTMHEFAACGAGAAADLLGRTRFGPALTPPYFASWVTGALAHTQGGLRVDAHARVLRADGSVIPHLFAAGGAAASLAGRGGEGYLPGNGLAQSFGLGMLAGEAMAAGRD